MCNFSDFDIMKLRVFNLLVQNPQYFLQCVYAWRHFMSFIPVLLRPPFFFQSFGCTHRGSPKDLQKSRSLQTKSNKLRLMNAILIQQSFLFYNTTILWNISYWKTICTCTNLFHTPISQNDSHTYPHTDELMIAQPRQWRTILSRASLFDWLTILK